MGQTIEGVRSDGAGTPPPEPTRQEVLLTHARTATERRLVEQFASEKHPGAVILEREDPGLAERLAEHGDPDVIPVRVTWVPRERGGDRSVRASDLLALTNPRRPPARLQQRIARREPDRVHVVAGDGASVSDLRRRFREQSGTSGTPQAFGAFIARQAVLALDRADRAIIGDRYKIPRLVAEQITASQSFREEVDKLAGEEGRTNDEVMAEATEALEELATVQSRLAIDAFRLVLSPMHARAYDVEVDVEGLERLREINRKHALIFLPTHRSYADPLVLAEVLHENDFPRNHLLGGNNLSFWPIGPLGKRAGVIFIRRSFGDDRVYKLAMREYLGHLVAKRFNIEWYIEGGRTRTGKLRPPKYGLLHYLATAIDRGRADDVMLVPVSINYSRLHEVATMAEEQGGKKKSAEGLGWLAGYMRAQQSRVGKVRIDFGDPLSLATALDDAGEGRARLEKVAFRICDGINRITPVTAPSLVTFALLGTPDRALTLEQVARIVEPAISYVSERDIPGEVEPLRKPGPLRAALDQLVTAGVVTCFDGGTEPVWSITPGNHVVAAFYRNGALHHFLSRAIIELGLLHVAREKPDGDIVEDAWEYSLKIRDLLKFEFFFADKDTFREQLRDELRRLDPDWRDRAQDSEQATKLLRASRLLVANRALRSFLDAQLVVSERLAARNPREAVDKEAFLEECLGVGRQMLLQGRLHSAESVSQELFAGALALAKNRDLVDPGRDEVQWARQAFYEEVCGVVDLVEEIRKLDEAVIEEVLNDDLPDRAVDAILAAERGPQIAAFFDYDGTVISGFSAAAFYEHRIRNAQIGPLELAKTLLFAQRGIHSEEDFARFLELSLSSWNGKTEEEIEKLSEKLFKHAIASRLHLEVWKLAEAHRAMGHTLVLASSATRFQVLPMARELSVDHALCTPVEIIDGVLTGKVAGEPLWAGGKARAIRALAQEHELDLDASFAYSNGTEDIEFLATVGNPTAVEPEAGLLAEAERRHWPVLRCKARGGRPAVLDVARTVGFYSAFAGASAAGLGLGILNRSRQTMIEIGGGVGADIGLSIAGIDVKVVDGHEHLWASRPCVFVFNHQSKLDPIVMMKLLRSDFTGVAKAEVKTVPMFGQLFQVAGVAFVERGNTGQAKRALEPAVAKVRDERVSLVIAPEGTRSATPRLGPFKKGAFHIAMQAGVPMVPIVLRNVGEMMWRGAQMLSPGTIEVAALPAVDTSDWTPETVADHVKEVRDMFLATLADWPGDPLALPAGTEAAR